MNGYFFYNNKLVNNYSDYWIEGIGSFRGFFWRWYGDYFKNRTCGYPESSCKDFSLGVDTTRYICRDSLSIQPPVFVSNKEVFKDETIYFYPNPTKNIITINNLNDKLPINVSITNIQGKVIRKEPSENVIDLNGVSSGLYFIHIEYNDGKRLTQKLIINH